MTENQKINEFGLQLLDWSSQNKRELPWKINKDPYKIWVSEIILQQTRVNQGLPYFERFIQAFPNLTELARADEEDVLQIWQGLGYYSRARNMHFTAKFILKYYKGNFPGTYQEIIQLKGIGPYTAAAISSFAFGESKAVVDGNVVRVLSRIWGIFEDYTKSSTKKKFQNLADQLIKEHDPSQFNQSIMDFGAMQCRPGKPNCEECQMKTICFAKKEQVIDKLPYRSSKTEIKNRFLEFYAFLLPHNELILHKRRGKDIWKGLYDLPSIEHENGFENQQSDTKFKQLVKKLNLIETIEINGNFDKIHLLTHQRIHARMKIFHTKRKSTSLPGDFYLVDYKNLCNFAYPKLIDWYIKEKILPLIGIKRNQNDK